MSLSKQSITSSKKKHNRPQPTHSNTRFPTPHLLAQFASKTYTDFKKGQTDAQNETRLALPDVWKLLTATSNIIKGKGCLCATC